MDNYTLIHLHTDMSNGTTNIDSITKYDEYIKKAKEYGMESICFTEHGNIFGWTKKKQCAEENGLKYIHGIETYVTENIEEKIRDNYHCVLIAKNYEGVKEINRLSSKAFNRQDGHFYYTPRITFDELISTSDNIFISTACLGGILHNGSPELQRKFIMFLTQNKHRCFLEIQHHKCKDQVVYNQRLYELSQKTGIPLIVGTDTHALNDEHVEGRKILQKSKHVNFANEDEWDLRLKSYDELIAAFEEQDALPMNIVRTAIEMTNVLANQVEEFTLDRSYKYPHLWADPMKTFKEAILEGARRRNIFSKPNYQEYKKRINYELKSYIHNNAIDFMLLMTDIIKWCQAHDIQVGYGRGSVNGSVIAWLLGITEMDSIKHGLNYERFMNVERVSLADIDTDFPPSRIEEVKQYIFSKPGLHCSDIITFNTIALKGAIRDVCRALYEDSVEDYMAITDKICKFVEDDEEHLRKQYPEVFKYVDLVQGTIVSIGSHPCGCIVYEENLEEEIGTCTTATSNYPISQIYMKEIDFLNYVKLDLLRLDTIEVINETCKLAGIERLTPDNVDITDEKVWNSIRDDTTNIFQWEGGTGDTYIKKLLSDKNIKCFKEVDENIDRMTLLSIGNSAIRPAGASYREDLASGVVRKTGSKPIDEFLSNTFGYLVFQEQIIFFLHLYCGFTMGEADVVRRGFAKKTGTDKYIPIIKSGGKLTEDSEHYISGYIETMKEKYGISEEKSEQDIVAFIQVIEDASSYLFSLNHSQPYSYEGYVEGYLRYYYPLEFLTVALNINKDKEEKTKALLAYANKNGIKILPPKFRLSKAGYFFSKEQNAIYKGIGSIKHINNNVADDLYSIKDNYYETFIDLLKDIQTLRVDSRQLEILVGINFFEEFGEMNYLYEVIKIFNSYYGKKQLSKFKILELGINEDVIKRHSTETAKMYKNFDSEAIVKEMINCIKYKPMSIKQKLKNEYNSVGIITYKNPKINKHIYFVSELEVKKSIVNIQLHEIYSGKTREVKMWTNQYNRDPFSEGDILFILSIDKKNKKDPTGEINPDTGKKIYRDVPDKFEFWLGKYIIKDNVEVGD